MRCKGWGTQIIILSLGLWVGRCVLERESGQALYPILQSMWDNDGSLRYVLRSKKMAFAIWLLRIKKNTCVSLVDFRLLIRKVVAKGAFYSLAWAEECCGHCNYFPLPLAPRMRRPLLIISLYGVISLPWEKTLIYWAFCGLNHSAHHTNPRPNPAPNPVIYWLMVGFSFLSCSVPVVNKKKITQGSHSHCSTSIHRAINILNFQQVPAYAHTVIKMGDRETTDLDFMWMWEYEKLSRSVIFFGDG